jgi:hypothetical protein
MQKQTTKPTEGNNMKSVRALLLATSMLALGLTPVLAEAPPTGSYTNSFTGLPVWDVSGSYNEDILGGSLSGSYTIAQDAQGKLTGSGDAIFQESGVYLAMDMTINGSVKGANGITTVVLTEKFSGTGSIDDPEGGDPIPFRFSGSVTPHMTVDQGTRRLTGAMSGKVCVSARGQSACQSLEKTNGGPIAFDMPIADSEMDGSWDLAVHVQNIDGKQLITDGTVLLSNGRAIQLGGKGKYQPTTDQSKLSLKGDKLTLSKGASLKLIANGVTFEIISMTGKLLGQKPVLTAP